MTRIIARLDVKPPHLVKPVHFDGLRVLGSPRDFALRHAAAGADEIFYLDIVASLYRRPFLLDQLRKTGEELFVPLAAGGGIRSLEDIRKLMRHGVDKVVLNTYPLQHDETLLSEAASFLGSQAVVLHIQAKQRNGWWECYSDCGRIPSGKEAVEWAVRAEKLGAGEILLSSVDHDGRKHGYACELVRSIVEAVKIPVVASSGAGSIAHVTELVRKANPDGIAVASLFHYGIATPQELKNALAAAATEVV